MDEFNTLPSLATTELTDNLMGERSHSSWSMNKVAKKTKGSLIRAKEGCPFCDIKRGPINDYWIKDLNHGSLFLNYNQSFEGRCIYMPFTHFNSLHDINEDLFNDFNKEVLFLSNILQRTFSAELINVAILGNAVKHLHWHLIPRYKNDSNYGKAPWPNQEKRLAHNDIQTLKERIKTQLLLK